MSQRISGRTFRSPKRDTRFFWVGLYMGCCLCIPLQGLAAQSGKCSQSMVDKLEAEPESIRDWSKLREFYHRYQVCQIDDAEVEGGVGESVVRMFIDHWDTLPTASRLFRRDPQFATFALAGLNSTDLTDDLNHIDKLAKDSCPINLHDLCGKIRRSIRDNE
jgi:hypothetical protein